MRTRFAVPAVLMMGVAGAGCYSEPFSCLREACAGTGVALRVWIDSADWRLNTVKVYDVTAANDRALFESDVTRESTSTAPRIGEYQTPLCQDFSVISLIDADLPDSAAGQQAGIAIDVSTKDCSNLFTGCGSAFAGHTFTTLTGGCQTVMMTATVPP